MEYFQQGDVLIKKIDEMPKKVKKLKTTVIAEGEATGHAHRIIGDGSLYVLGQTMFLQAKAEVELKHEEHDPIKIPPGVYAIDNVREFDHFKQESRKVVD